MLKQRWIIVALAALVTAAAVIVYATRGGLMRSKAPEAGGQATSSGAETSAPKSSGVTEVPKPVPSPPPAPPPQTQAAVPPEPPPTQPVPLEPLPPAEEAPATQGAADAHGVLHDVKALPSPARRMLKALMAAAKSGELENMRTVLEMNELKPMVAVAAVADPIAYWKQHSASGDGRDVLAALVAVLNSGFVKMKEGPEVMYVWPYFAEKDLASLTPEEAAELNKLVPAPFAGAMLQSGKYSYYRVGIDANGVWHYFLQ